jgi:NAD(P)-dependent dehydrogenase (short-subunit alcohol dehydrogenase family)
MTDGRGPQPVDLTGAVAVVTGGGSGIGAALAQRLTDEGARVAVVDLHRDAAERVASELTGARAFGLDVTDGDGVAAMVTRVEEDLGPVDVYCSNAGIGTGPGLGDDEAWAASWAVHGMAHVRAARAVMPSMVARGGGHFVITASAAGLLMMMQSAPYTVTKHASVAIAEWMSVEYGGAGVSVHCLCPQGVRTPMVTSDPKGEAEVAASGTILEPATVAGDVVDSLRSGRFLVLPHPEVATYEAAKVADRDRWLGGMRKLRARIG